MTNRKRIRDFLPSPQVGYSSTSTELLNNLAESIFPHSSSKGIGLAYIPSELNTGKPFGGLTKDQVGDHELGLLQKILGLSSENQVLVLYGPKGCGKTTTIKHIINLTKNLQPIETSEFPKVYTPVWLDLNEEKFRKVNIEDQANSLVIEQLCQHIHSEIALNRTNWLSKDEEINDFWSYEFERIKNDKTGKSVFRDLTGKIDNSLPEGYKEDDTQYLPLCRKLLIEIHQQGGENRLEYLFRLLSYIHRKISGNSLFWIVIDNLDGASLALQRAAVVITRRFMAVDKNLGIRFLVATRPETLKSRGLYLDFYDLVEHTGIKPSELIQYRIDIFLGYNGEFRQTCPAITDTHFNEILKFIKKIRNKDRDWEQFKNFIDNVSGKSLRNGLLLAEGIIKVHYKDINDTKSNVHDVIRACIRRGYDSFVAEKNSIIEQLFGVRFDEDDHNLLIKPRILMMLKNKNSATLGELIGQMDLFGYPIEQTFIPAINDMLRLETQLCCSNGRLEYSYNEAITSSGDLISLSDVGKSYFEILFGDLDYIQEVMLDVSVKDFPQTSDTITLWLPEKIDLIRKFVEILYKQDIDEMEKYLTQPTNALFAISSYIQHFGSNCLLVSILFQRLRSSVDRLVDFEKRTSQGPANPERRWDEVLAGYDHIENLIFNSNARYFGDECLKNK